MQTNASILVIAGLGDDLKKIKRYIKNLQKYFDVAVTIGKWQSKETIQEKKERIRKEIKNLKGVKKGIIGLSASGHLAIYSAIDFKEISAIGAVSSRLFSGKNVFPPVKLAVFGYPVFYKSLTEFEEKVFPFLDREIKNKIITTRGSYDWSVPTKTSFIQGVENLVFRTNRFNILNHLESMEKGIRSDELIKFFLKKLS